jgi:hypothetical protein
MRKRHLSRRLIGLLAAYLVALQALILPMAMPASAAPFGGLCLGAQRGVPAHHPAGEDQNCPCCAGCGMQCNVPTFAAGASIALPPLGPWVVAELSPAFLPGAPIAAHRSRQMARGPPAA